MAAAAGASSYSLVLARYTTSRQSVRKNVPSVLLVFLASY